MLVTRIQNVRVRGIASAVPQNLFNDINTSQIYIDPFGLNWLEGFKHHQVFYEKEHLDFGDFCTSYLVHRAKTSIFNCARFAYQLQQSKYNALIEFLFVGYVGDEDGL